MGMFSSFSTALSAMDAEQTAISVTGNNLANLNTTGFKGSDLDFRNLVSQSMGSDGETQVGMGVAPPLTIQMFTQGTIASSSSPLDTAIQGDGFYVVQNSNGQQLFTRDGSFAVSSSGVLQTQTGEDVQGWMAGATGVNTSGATTNIVIPSGAVLSPAATQNMSMDVNLNANGSASDNSNTFSEPIQVVDSLGAEHTLTVTFTKNTTTPDTWSYDVTIDGGDVTGGTAGTPQSVLSAPGTLTFNPDGTLKSPAAGSPVAIAIPGLADGASNMAINWNLFNSAGAATITQYAQTSSASSPTQDGSEAAQLSGVAINTGGQVVATFSNGQTKVEAQLALASIQNPDTLTNVGNNNLAVSGLTATPSIGAPNTGDRGQILGSSLEESNVDIAQQFTNLIVYQQGYEAASKVITTSDEMSQDLIGLIR